jgi:hypothetical protein
MAPTKRGAAVDVEEIIAAAKAQKADDPKARPARRSAIYRWMWDNFDLLKPEFNSPVMFGTQRWQAVAEQLGARGYSAGLGTTPTGETVRKTWWKVSRARAEWEKNGEARRPTGRTSRPEEAAEGVVAEVRAPTPPVPRYARTPPVPARPAAVRSPLADEGPPLSPPARRFGVATPKDWDTEGQDE